MNEPQTPPVPEVPAEKNYFTIQILGRPDKVVTDCYVCPFAMYISEHQVYACATRSNQGKLISHLTKLLLENSNGITETCPHFEQVLSVQEVVDTIDTSRDAPAAPDASLGDHE